ncbi:DUF5712 family protein [Allomuricauda taeanensis]|uniref:DUF5712 family protein n=1 Tax=Flagellimonas taeanensis TaxID=1005926 RepID=UPI002E7ADAB6|nr:DUF5712 family protein [Allomuricauda taeanensis]MEE1963851.1 DUF5712 family protein [Allomuricauda taeanensis]
MYLTISAQKMGSTYNSSVGNYVDYLEKENQERLPGHREEFFAKVMGLPTKEKHIAFKLLKTMGVKAPNIPTNKVQMAAKIIKAHGKGINKSRGHRWGYGLLKSKK